MEPIKHFLIRFTPAFVREKFIQFRDRFRTIPDVAKTDHQSYQVVPNKFWITFNEGKWEPDLQAFFKRHLGPGKTYLDIGGWQGASLFTALSFKPDRVIVVEANPDTYEILKKNCELNELNQTVDLVHACLSDRSGKIVEFGPMDDHLPHSAIHGIGGKGRSVETVSFLQFLTSIDIQSIDVVKIDIEGGERYLSEGLSYLSQIPGMNIFLALHPPFWSSKEETAGELIQVIKKFRVFNSGEQPISYDLLREKMLREEKTFYREKKGEFFDIILKSRGSVDRSLTE